MRGMCLLPGVLKSETLTLLIPRCSGSWTGHTSGRDPELYRNLNGCYHGPLEVLCSFSTGAGKNVFTNMPGHLTFLLLCKTTFRIRIISSAFGDPKQLRRAIGEALRFSNQSYHAMLGYDADEDGSTQ